MDTYGSVNRVTGPRPLIIIFYIYGYFMTNFCIMSKGNLTVHIDPWSNKTFRYSVDNVIQYWKSLVVFHKIALDQLKVDFIQKVLMHLSFPQTDEPYYFPELEFWIYDISKGSNHVIIRVWSLKAQTRLHFAIWTLQS